MKKGKHTFKSRHFHFRPANGIGSALMEAGATVPLIREARIMHVEPDGRRNVIHATSN